MSDAARAKAEAWDQGRFSAGLVDEVIVLLDAYAAEQTARVEEHHVLWRTTMQRAKDEREVMAIMTEFRDRAERAEALAERLRAMLAFINDCGADASDTREQIRTLLADPKGQP